jgi:hypothetical protein
MSKKRMVDTRFWIDDYISHLDPVEKLMFLYFLTNPFTDISGMYEVPLKNIALDTGIDKEMVIKILNRFERDNKIFYENGWIAIKNFAKHQLDNPKVLRGIEIGRAKAPESLKNKVKNSLSIDNDSLSHLNSNSNLNSNLNERSEETSQVNPLIELFKEVNPSYSKLFANKTQRGSAERLLKTHGLQKLSGLIKLLPQMNGDKYAPVITTPVQLEDKLGQLIAYGQRKQANSPLMI